MCRVSHVASTVVIAVVVMVAATSPALANEHSPEPTVTVETPDATLDRSQPGSPGARDPAQGTETEEQRNERIVQQAMCALVPYVGPEAFPWCFPQPAATAPGDPGYELALRLRSQLTITMPGMHTAPPLGAAAVVGLATWLWVDDSATRTLSATATEGPLTVTITAKPLGVDFDTGDGGRLHCAGNGSPFIAGVTDPHTKPACSHTYTQRSTANDPRDAFTLRASITYAISWTASTGQGGPLAPTTVSATAPIAVHELQATLD